jgi:PAT family beta-lactamase induction signal transducer AmpG
MKQRLLIIGLLGFSSAIPLFLTSSTLAIWLAEKGVSYKAVGLFSLVSFPYALRFVWAPLVDRMPLPYLTRRFGRRRSWLLLSQVSLMSFLSIFAIIDPTKDLTLTAFLALCITFSAATQETLMMTYQMESLPQRQYGPGEAVGVFGYRMGMLVSGAGALYIASCWNWTFAYLAMALLVGVGLLTTLSVEEPKSVMNAEVRLQEEQARNYLIKHPRLKGTFGEGLAWLYAAVICPFSDFMRQKGWLASLLLMLSYKLGDNLIGPMANVFYLELGFSKIEIANASKLFGIWASIFGGLISGIIVTRLGFLRSLLLLGLLHAVANLMYVIMFYAGYNTKILYITIAIEHITSGMRTTALFAYQLTLCNVSYAATQLALVASLVNLSRTCFASLSGWLVEGLGWVSFFSLTAIASLPGLLLVLYLMHLNNQQPLKLIRN